MKERDTTDSYTYKCLLYLFDIITILYIRCKWFIWSQGRMVTMEWQQEEIIVLPISLLISWLAKVNEEFYFTKNNMESLPEHESS